MKSAYDAGVRIMENKNLWDPREHLENPMWVWMFGHFLADKYFTKMYKNCSKNQKCGFNKDKMMKVLCAILAACRHKKREDNPYAPINWWSTKGICKEFMLSRTTFDKIAKLLQREGIIFIEQIKKGQFKDENGVSPHNRCIYGLNAGMLDQDYLEWLKVEKENE